MKNNDFNSVEKLKEVINMLFEIHAEQKDKEASLFHEYKYKLSDPGTSISNILGSKDLLKVALQESRIQKICEVTEKLIILYEDYIDEFFESVKKY